MSTKYLRDRPLYGDFMLDVAAGNIPGLSEVLKFGRNINIAAGEKQEIWDGQAIYSWPTTALMTSLSQTTDQVAMRGADIHIEGLDVNFQLFQEEVNLDAADTTTVVTLPTPLLRVFRMSVRADVVGDSDIRVHNAAETQDYAIIGAGNNQTEMAIYTVPAGHTAYMVDYYAVLNPAVNLDPTSMQISLWARDRAMVWESQQKHTTGLDVDATSEFRHPFTPYQPFTEKTDIYITGAPVGKNADISAGFDLILAEN